jgi:rubrerythrin
MWGKIRNLLKKSAGRSDVCRDSHDGLYTEEQLRVLPHLEKETAGGNTTADLQRLIEKYKKEITQLEAQVKEIEHKRDILVEAARLLQEEVLAPHRSQYEELSDMHTKKGSHCSQP